MQREAQIDELFASTQSLIRGWKNYFYKVLGPEHISPAQLGILFHLHAHGPSHGRNLSTALHTSPSALSQLLESLDNLGYITRQQDPNDRRVAYFGLSPMGTEKVADLNEKRKSFFRQVTESLTDDEIHTMVAIQQKMTRHIESQK